MNATLIPILAGLAAQPLSSSRVLNANAAADIGDDDAPSVAMDASGHVVAVWTSTDTLSGTIGSDSDIVFATSSDRGLTWSLPLPMPGASSDSAEDRAPRIATDAAGTWVVVWQSRSSDSDILIARSFDDGASWTTPVPIEAGGTSDSAEEPQLATDRSGRWIVVWTSDSDIRAAVSIDAASSFSGPIALTASPADDRAPTVATNEAGRWIIVWESNDTLGGTLGSDFDILFTASSDDGSTWSPFRPLNTNAATDTGDDAAIDLAGDGSGHWVAVWQSREPLPWGPDWDILVARSASGGASWSAPSALYSFAVIELGDEYDPRILTDRAGNWWVLWTRVDSLPGSNSEDSDILQARSTNFGLTWTGPELINFEAITDVADDYRPAPATSRTGDWVAVWGSLDAGGSLGFDRDLLVATAGCGDGVRQAGEECDDGNVLDGDCCSGACHIETAGTVCRAANGACDVSESCNGFDPSCPSDAFAPSARECRPAAGACDEAEYCTGSSAECPMDELATPMTICRATAGLCDVAESCNGVSADCPDDEFLDPGTICRASNGACDVADACSGVSSQCADTFASAGVVCRESSGPCDVAEICDGTRALCGANRFLPAGTSCRPAADLCDAAEVCTGSSGACPFDLLRSIGSICRPAAGSCDVAESCDGSSLACPEDRVEADGAQCSDGVVCNGSEVCDAGRCVSGSALGCGDRDLCTVEGCFEPGGCGAARIVGCCMQDSDCDDGDPCSTDSCSGPGGTCSSSQIPDCDAPPNCVASAECDDGDPCTTDRCIDGACTQTEVAGCCTTDADCDDRDACTRDACAANLCVSKAIAGCCTSNADCNGEACAVDADCDDFDACTIDRCSEAACAHDPLPECEPPVIRGSDPGVALEDEQDPTAVEAPPEIDPEPESEELGGFVYDDDGCECSATEVDRSLPLAPLAILVLIGMRRRDRSRSRPAPARPEVEGFVESPLKR